ncbi:hypothetical protein DM02DRAFT_689020 [Periconia macrospinosa]|uniref:Uncharacterized protein n=1 Tax=Periconia macrospinosa TaxID=97972 RepID=A0A2V1E4D5_9PLEO|nr:hypothetical protein DM02DRAFT_689020 [Periconia macrospinosa]
MASPYTDEHYQDTTNEAVLKFGRIPRNVGQWVRKLILPFPCFSHSFIHRCGLIHSNKNPRMEFTFYCTDEFLDPRRAEGVIYYGKEGEERLPNFLDDSHRHEGLARRGHQLSWWSWSFGHVYQMAGFTVQPPSHYISDWEYQEFFVVSNKIIQDYRLAEEAEEAEIIREQRALEGNTSTSSALLDGSHFRQISQASKIKYA